MQRFDPALVERVKEEHAKAKARVNDVLAAVRDNIGPEVAKMLDEETTKLVKRLSNDVDALFFSLIHEKMTIQIAESLIAGEQSAEILSKFTK